MRGVRPHMAATSPRPLRQRLRRFTCTLAVSAGGLAALAPASPAAAEPGAITAEPAAAVAGSAAPAVVGFPLGPDSLTATAANALTALQASIAAGTGDGSVSYLVLRSQIVADVATRLGIDATTLRAAWAGADPGHQVALMAGLTQLGVRYQSMAREPGSGFDCSGLTSFAWSAAGQELPRSSGDQIDAASPRDTSTAQAGDLLRYPGHVMLWLGVGSFILHSPYSGEVVRVEALSDSSMSRSAFGDPVV